MFTHDLYSEIREEIGLFRSATEKRSLMTSDSTYREFRSYVDDLDSEDIESLVPVSFCRELLRGGKPQLFFLGFTNLNREELIRRRLMATRIAENQKRREEIDARLLEMMPDFDQMKALNYNHWVAKVHETGFTLEVLPLLHYASQVSFDSLVP
jgi:hypothetical protein